MAPKTSTFFDLKTCLGKSYRHSSFANFSGGGAVVWCLLVGVFGFLFVFCFGLLLSGLPGEFLHLICFLSLSKFQ